jgi:hypothetical protein
MRPVSLKSSYRTPLESLLNKAFDLPNKKKVSKKR